MAYEKKNAAKKWKPSKYEKPLVYFNLKSGTWLFDANVMRQMIKNGLGREGIRMGKSHLEYVYKVSKEDLKK